MGRIGSRRTPGAHHGSSGTTVCTIHKETTATSSAIWVSPPTKRTTSSNAGVPENKSTGPFQAGRTSTRSQTTCTSTKLPAFNVIFNPYLINSCKNRINCSEFVTFAHFCELFAFDLFFLLQKK